MKLNHPQLKQFVVQNIAGQIIPIDAFHASHAQLTAEVNGNVVVRIMTKEEFDRQQQGFAMGLYLGFQEGIKKGMGLAQEDTGEKITQLQTWHIAKFERNIP